jgi:peroxiredoxin
VSEDLMRMGPAAGTPFPDITLPDQTGAPVRLQEARGGRPALVVFYRSARW